MTPFARPDDQPLESTLDLENQGAVVAMEAGKWLRSRGTLVLREIGHATVIGLALVPLPPSLLLALIPRASFSTSSYILNIAPMLPSLIPFPMPVPLRVGVECDHYIRTKAISFRRPRVVNSEFDGAKCRLSLFGGLLVLHHSFGNGPKEIPEAFSTALGDVSPAVPSS